MVVLIDFIAILLTPGIFLIQIVNTNVYLIHFHSKNNIQMRFPKVGFLSFKPISIIHYPSQQSEINCVDISELHNNVLPTDFQKHNLINNYYIYN